MDIAFRKKAEEFVSDLPYKKPPYGNRNWGHPWHSLCSYHGKLKPAIAHWLVSDFTKEGDVVLDPLCGVGTIPFEACLQGRIGIGNDLSELAYPFIMPVTMNIYDPNTNRTTMTFLKN